MNEPAAFLHRRLIGRAAALLLPCTVLLTGAAFAATTVYRSIDAQGNVVFSDQPPGPGETAETLEITTPATFGAPASNPAGTGADAGAWDWDMEAGEPADQTPFVYAALAIVAPAHDEGLRDNAGNVTIVAGVEPDLRPGHLLEILLDGAVVSSGPGNTATLTEVERGTHTLEARILDDQGTVLITSQPSTFHMLRYVPALAPNRPKPVPHGG
jgi:hypothetical protein